MKYFFKTNFLYIILLLGVISCRPTQPTHSESLLVENKSDQIKLSPLGYQLTDSGSNKEISFSPTGNYFTFISEGRFLHLHRQVYEYDLKNKIEKRVTFSDGQNYHPSYSLVGDIIFYSSNTDKIKEYPTIFYPEKNNPLLQLDIYSTDNSGKIISRLIQNESSSVNIQSIPNTVDDYLYVQKDISENKILKLQLHSKKSTTLHTTKNAIQSILAHKDGTLYWIENNQIFFKERSKPIIKLADHLQFQQLSWINPEKKVMLYLAKINNKKTEIGIYRDKEKCMAEILESDENIQEAIYNLSKEILLTVILKDGKSQIFAQTKTASDFEAVQCQSQN